MLKDCPAASMNRWGRVWLARLADIIKPMQIHLGLTEI